MLPVGRTPEIKMKGKTNGQTDKQKDIRTGNQADGQTQIGLENDLESIGMIKVLLDVTKWYMVEKNLK